MAGQDDMNLSPEQVEKVADANGEVYRREVFKSTWKTRSQSLWAGGILGVLFGGAIGVAAAAAAVIAGASMAVIAPVAAVFALAGMGMGVAGFTDVGSTVGAMIGGRKVSDRQRLMNHPSNALEDSVNYQGVAQQEKQAHPHGIPLTEGSKKIFNVRAGLTLALGGLALGGLLLATGGAAAILPASLALSHSAMTALTLTATTLFGALFGVDIPTIGSNMIEKVAGLYKKSPSPDEMQMQASASPVPTRPLPQITPEELALLNERQNSNGKSFTQTVTGQPTHLTLGV